jgi:hypothetical protein
MGGLGTRLGLPFNKGLAPTFAQGGILPLYAHAYDRLRRVSDRIVFVLGEGDDIPSLPGERVVSARAGLAGALRDGARGLAPDDLCAVALPDSMWWPKAGLKLLVAAYGWQQPCDGVLGTFDGSSHVLDRVTLSPDGRVSAVERHSDPPTPPRYIRGWGAFVARTGVLAGLRDDEPLGPQLAAHRFASVHLGEHYYDLGTPARYRANIDRPLHMDPDL